MARNNKNGKFTFNIIDALIILLITCVVALIIYVLILGHDLGDLLGKNQENGQVVASLEPTEQEICDYEFSSRSNIGVDNVYR